MCGCVLIIFRFGGCPDASEKPAASNFMVKAGIKVIRRKYDLTHFCFLTGAQDSHLQRVTISEAAYIQLRRRPPEDEHSNARNM
jgi:hypothetical protein